MRRSTGGGDVDSSEITVVHIITRFINGGADENTLEACNWSAQRGDLVYLFIGRAFDQAIVDKLDDRVRVVMIPDLVNPISPLKDLKAFLQIRNALVSVRPDIVHTHTSKAGILGRAAAHSTGVPGIIHGIHIAPFQNVGLLKRHLYLALEKLAARWTDAFISVSEGMRRAYLNEGIGAPERHSVIHSGMKLSKYRASAPNDWHSLLGRSVDSQKPKIVLMLAGLERRKRHAELIDAFVRVFAVVPDAILVLAGGGRDREIVEQRVKASPFRDRICLLGHVEDPGSLIALADIAVHCAVREGLPRVMVQYLAGGLPVVMTQLPGVGSLIVDGVNGRVVDQDNFDELSSAIVETLIDAEKLEALRRGARRKDVSSWDVSNTGRKQQSVYDDVLRRSAAVSLDNGVRVMP